MGKYILNKGTGTLHREDCGHAKDIFNLGKAFLLEEVFSGHEGRKVKCCPCLNKDRKAHEFVEKYNKICT